MREGTKAASFPNQVLPEIKEERSRKIIELSNEIQLEYNKSYIGKAVNVLVEEMEDGIFKGHTANYLNVNIMNAKENIENKIVKVKIIDVKNDMLIGKVE